MGVGYKLKDYIFLTSLKLHQSKLKPLARKYRSTLVLLKSFGHLFIFCNGLISFSRSYNIVEKFDELPKLTTTLMDILIM